MHLVPTCTFELHKCIFNTFCVPDIMLDFEDKKLSKTPSQPSRGWQSTGEKDIKQIISTRGVRTSGSQDLCPHYMLLFH